MNRTLLLADDSIVSQKLVGLAFANEDVTVEVVHSGEDAHRRVQEIRPDIILVDLGLPGANAYELCEVIKREPKTAQVAVILLADRPGEIDPTMARRARCDAHLVKPLDSVGLVRTPSPKPRPVPKPWLRRPPAPPQRPISAQSTSKTKSSRPRTPWTLTPSQKSDSTGCSPRPRVHPGRSPVGPPRFLLARTPIGSTRNSERRRVRPSPSSATN